MEYSASQQEQIEREVQHGFVSILDGYKSATETGTPTQSPIRRVFQSLARGLMSSPTVRYWGERTRVDFGVGRFNNWASVPWVAILDTRVTTSAQRGVYVVYLFCEDMSGVYVTLNQGATEVNAEVGSNADAVRRRLREKAAGFRDGIEWLEADGFKLDTSIDLKTGTPTGKAYEAGTIAYRFYSAAEFPPGSILLHELQPLLEAYKQIKARHFAGARPTNVAGRQWCVYVPSAAKANFEIAEREGVWGAALPERIAGISEGDRILFVLDLKPDSEPPQPGFPRVAIEAFSGVAARVVRAVVKSAPYNDPTDLWPDAPYPHRFRFDVEEVAEAVEINAITLSEEVLDALRRSAALGGRPILAGSLLRGTTDDDQVETESAPATPDPVVDNYGIDNALDDLFIERERLLAILDTFRRKKNLILQGPPGVGKNFVARRLAYLLMQQKDETRLETVQFHQSYSYEDFVQGWRPEKSGGFKLVNGVFFRFCEQARRDTRPHVFIIDEINRGNTSKIFGELFSLIETDKRGAASSIPLVYSVDSGDRFSIPPNVYLLGLMNTADRSLAMVDYALRRRFSFASLVPQFESPSFASHLEQRGVSGAMISRIRERMGSVNAKIGEDAKNLGPGFEIGHSFFCERDAEASDEAGWFQSVVLFEIAPLIEEYYFDDKDKADSLIGELLG